MTVSRRRRRKPIVETKPSWFSQHPVLSFLLVFAVLMGLFYAFVIFTPFYKRDFLLSYLPFNARLSGAILSFLGQLKSGQYFYGSDSIKIIDWHW